MKPEIENPPCWNLLEVNTFFFNIISHWIWVLWANTFIRIAYLIRVIAYSLHLFLSLAGRTVGENTPQPFQYFHFSYNICLDKLGTRLFICHLFVVTPSGGGSFRRRRQLSVRIRVPLYDKAWPSDGSRFLPCLLNIRLSANIFGPPLFYLSFSSSFP